jgi:isopenicillin-N epimerase
VQTVKPPDPIPGARLLFSLDPAVSHLNHGSFGAVPVAVQRAQQRLRDEVEANPVRFYAGGSLYDRIAAARRHLAGFVGLDPDGCALVANATTGAAIVLGSVRLEPGDEIVTTDHRYGAVSLAVARTCHETGAVAREAPVALAATDDDVVTAVRTAVTGRTRLVVLDLVTSPTARVFPVAAVHAALRGTGVPLFVDAAHGPGLVTDPAPGDFWVGNLHKWAYAPRGTALLHVAEPWRHKIRAPVVSWREPEGFPGALEFAGVTDLTPWLAAPVGTYVLRTLGVEMVRRHNAELAAYGQATVGAALGLAASDLPRPGGAVQPGPLDRGPGGADRPGPLDRGLRSAAPAGSPGGADRPGPLDRGLRSAAPAGSPGGDLALPMRVVPLPPGVAATPDDAAALRRRIADNLQTEVAVNSWRGRGLLRLSAQVYNRAEEYERLAERLPGFLRGVQRT